MLFLAVALTGVLAACSKHEEPGSEPAPADSVLTAPVTPAPSAPPFVDTASGLVIDSFIVSQQADMQVLKGFEPQRVVNIYEAFRPLRNLKTPPAQLDSFLTAQKITAPQLHSILSEGDRLGWSGKRSH